MSMTLEQRLFRLSIGLKFLFWGALAAILIVGIADAAMGRVIVPPIKLFWLAGGLAALQLGTLLAWWCMRRARLRNTRG